jgi:hypothetical protein
MRSKKLTKNLKTTVQRSKNTLKDKEILNLKDFGMEGKS